MRGLETGGMKKGPLSVGERARAASLTEARYAPALPTIPDGFVLRRLLWVRRYIVSSPPVALCAYSTKPAARRPVFFSYCRRPFRGLVAWCRIRGVAVASGWATTAQEEARPGLAERGRAEENDGTPVRGSQTMSPILTQCFLRSSTTLSPCPMRWFQGRPDKTPSESRGRSAMPSVRWPKSRCQGL